ncbi:MAG: 4'-phosphopantetheinyl transferase superfamily protein, partial [Gammaproteobacteria bacterium]|nr:4'-phosphopantetheinyl transferase superfamily protein [Gammaproteobacteria bacterium]
FNHQRYLSREELTRAGKYISGKKSREFIITRSALRNIIGYVLKKDPRQIGIAYTSSGMPLLDHNWSHTNITFNVSHSHDLAIIAVSIRNIIGIDIEKVRQDIEYEKLAKRFFSETEHKLILEYEITSRLDAFFATWTRKEALVKATGIGIAYGLSKFDVSVDPDQPAELLDSRWQSECQSKWSLLNIDTLPEYKSCLAVAGELPEVRYWRI